MAEPAAKTPGMPVIMVARSTLQAVRRGFQRELLVGGIAAGKEHHVERLAQVGEGGIHPYAMTEAEFGAQRFDQANLRIQHRARQAVFRDGIAQRAAGLLVLVEEQAGMPHLLQIIGGRKPGGAGADDGDLLPACRPAGGPVGGFAGQVEVGHEAFEQADGKRLIPLRAPAAFFAQLGADAPEHRRKGDVPFDGDNRLAPLSGGDLAQHGGDIHMCRTDGLARADAVAEVIAEQQLQRGTARVAHFRGIGLHHHALGHRRGARGQQARAAVHLHHAEHAGGERRVPLTIAERGNSHPHPPRRVNDGGAGFDVYTFVIDGDSWHNYIERRIFGKLSDIQHLICVIATCRLGWQWPAITLIELNDFVDNFA